MAIPLSPSLLNWILAGLLVSTLAAAVLWAALRRHAQRNGNAAELLLFSKIHFLASTIAESRSPNHIAEKALSGALEMLGATEGYLLLRSEGPEALDHAASRGFDRETVRRLGDEPLRSYLASCGERWGNLMVFPDLRRSDLIAAWQRDESFRELHRILTAEGLRTMVVLGLRGREKTFGTMLIGSRGVRHLKPGDLRFALAVGKQVSMSLENWQLTRATERRAEELQILHRVGEALRATFDLRVQVEILRRELRGLLGTANFSLALQDSPDSPLETLAGLENNDSGTCWTRISASGLAEYVQRSRAPLLVGEGIRETASGLGVAQVDPRLRTWCGVPIHFPDGSVGVLALEDFEREHGISARQFELIQILAQEAAGAIENARFFQKEQRRATHLALLNELGRKAMAVLNPQELLPSICRQIQSAFGYDATRIEVPDHAQQELVLEAQAGYGEQVLGRRTRFGEGLPGVVAETSEPVLANAALRDPRYVALHPGIRSALSIPLKYREKLLGILSLESCRENAFSQYDVSTLRTLADQLAIALHNAQAYQLALEQAITDALTGLKTHRYFMQALDCEWRQSTRSGQHFSVIMLNVDGFKQVNDRYGHLEGDKILALIAGLLADRARHSNVLARYGGDEFAILMGQTKSVQAAVLAERLRVGIEKDPLLAARGVTASFGVATFPTHGATQDEILRVADAGVYLAKHQKGNLVRVASVAPQGGQSEVEQQLLEAYLGATAKQMFSTGPEVFSQYLQRLERVTEGSRSEGPSLMNTVTALAFAIDAKDHYTHGHSQAVSRLAEQIARQIQLADAEVEEIRLAGILHDIGKIGVPETILNKPSRLSPEEYELVKSHAVLGERILEPLKVKAIERIRSMVRHHHEMFDGRGYPDQLKGEAIPLGARIIKVADCFDTIVSERTYKKAKSVEDAIVELRGQSGSEFDPSLVHALVQSLDVIGDPRHRESFAATLH